MFLMLEGELCIPTTHGKEEEEEEEAEGKEGEAYGYGTKAAFQKWQFELIRIVHFYDGRNHQIFQLAEVGQVGWKDAWDGGWMDGWMGQGFEEARSLSAVPSLCVHHLNQEGQEARRTSRSHQQELDFDSFVFRKQKKKKEEF